MYYIGKDKWRGGKDSFLHNLCDAIIDALTI